MLAVETVVLSRNEILDRIREYCAEVGCDYQEVIRAFRRGDAQDFEHLSEVFALSELLADDDPVFA